MDPSKWAETVKSPLFCTIFSSRGLKNICVHFFQKLPMGVFERRYASVQKTPLSQKCSSTPKNMAWGKRVTPPLFKNCAIWLRDKGGGVTATGHLCVQEERGGLPLYPCVWGLCGYNIYGLPPVWARARCAIAAFFFKKIVFFWGGPKAVQIGQNGQNWPK